MAAKPRKQTGKLVTLAELSRAWEYHKNADQVLGARMSYGMIAQSMFLLSYVTLYLVTAEPIWLPTAVQLGIASFGLWYTSRQNAMAEEEIARMRFLRKEYLSKDRIFAGHLPERPLKVRHHHVTAHSRVLRALGWPCGAGVCADRA